MTEEEALKESYRMGFHGAIWAIEAMREKAGGYEKAIQEAKRIHKKPATEEARDAG